MVQHYDNQFKQLLRVLYCAVHYLICNSTNGENCCTVQVKCCNGEHKALKLPYWENQVHMMGNVIHCVNKSVVWKHCDNKYEYLNPNTELMKGLRCYDNLQIDTEYFGGFKTIL